jgi:putative transposase
MPNYRRFRVPGGTCFFTVNLLQRRPNDLLVRHVDLLRSVVRDVQRRWPFHIDGWVVLPDHLHCIWTLPAGDTDFTNRWRLIKAGFARQLSVTEGRSRVRRVRGERGIWQRRFWEHAVRDERDYAAHMDYLHFNPVKHGYVGRVSEWPYSSFGRCVVSGIYPPDWGGAGDAAAELDVGERGD